MTQVAAAQMQVMVDDATIDVAVDGKGEAIVLIHGFPMTRDEWDDQVSALSAHALVIRPDLRGMGRSSVPDGPYLMETLAGDIAAVLDACGIERACIVGHSLGGYVAMAFARMYTERVRALALVCSRLAADSPNVAQSREDLADRADASGEIGSVIDAYIPKLFSHVTLENRSPVVTRARTIAGANSARGAAGMLRGMAQRVDATDIAGDLRMPVLLVAGGADQLVPLHEVQEMRRAFGIGPEAVAVMGHSGHLPMLEEPQALTDALAAFARAGH